ncbi:Fic family protein [Castellaniella sp.]|uniref:Fic family protein n=1 Tax=Castellaniella sp. TaxID=1955812 RepID=UPI003564082C
MCCIRSHAACTSCGADSAATICCVTSSSISACTASHYLLPALRSGLVEMTLPDTPRSSKQRYRLTALGPRWLETNPGTDAR